MTVATTTQRASSKRLRVLVVEDEMLLAMAMEDMLAEFDCEVIGPVARVAEALRLASTEVFDGAILDVNVAGTDVFPVAHELTQRGIPFIFVSGYDANRMPDEWRGRPLLRKPFEPRDLARRIAAAFPR